MFHILPSSTSTQLSKNNVALYFLGEGRRYLFLYHKSFSNIFQLQLNKDVGAGREFKDASGPHDAHDARCASWSTHTDHDQPCVGCQNQVTNRSLYFLIVCYIRLIV